jgi:hypothetical protein
MVLVFQTNNLDLALTKADAGFDVTYTGPHDGVFRFESVRRKALRAREKIARARAETFECALERLFEDARRESGQRFDAFQQ